MKGTRKHHLLVMVSFLILVMPANLRADSLQYQATLQVEAGLKSGELAQDFNIYFSGSQAEPHTIIGVLKSVEFRQSLWQGTDSTTELLQKWSEHIDNPYRPLNDQYWGGYVVSATGQYIGFWFSKHRFLMADFNDGVLSILQPFRRNTLFRRSAGK